MENMLLPAPYTHLIDIALLLLVVILCYALVDKFLGRYIKFDFSSPVEKFVFFEGLGLGILAYIVFIIGLLGLLYPWLIYLLLAISVLLVWDRIISIFKNIRLPDLSGTELVLIILLAIFMLCALLTALTPPVAIDETMYHLAVPKIYVMHHQVFNFHEMMRSSWIMTQEMLFTLGLLLKGDILAKLFHYLMGILMAITVYSFSRNYMSRAYSLLASLIFFSIPMIVWLSTVANNDLCLSYFELLAVYGITKWLFGREDGWLWFAAVFSGFALGTKYLGAYSLFAVLVSTLLFRAIMQKRVAIKPLLIFTSITIAIASVWYIRNIIYVQNPVFPFMNQVFHSKYWFSKFWAMDLAEFGMGRTIKDYLLLPWNLTFECRRFSREGYLGPLFLMCFPLLALLVRNKIKIIEPMRFLMTYAGIFFLIWALATQYIRYLIPVLPVFSIIAAYIICLFSRLLPSNIHKAMSAVIIAVIFLSLPFFTDLWVNSRYWGLYCYTVSYSDPGHSEDLKMFKMARRIVFGDISRNAYLSAHAQTSGSYPIIKYINETLPADTKIMTIYDFMYYYHDRNVRSDYDFFPEYGTYIQDLFAEPKKKYYSGMWTKDFYQKLKQLKFTHLLVNLINLRLINLDLTKNDAFFKFSNSYLKLVKFTHTAVLYEIKYENN